jgi:hypothetical protein
MLAQRSQRTLSWSFGALQFSLGSHFSSVDGALVATVHSGRSASLGIR